MIIILLLISLILLILYLSKKEHFNVANQHNLYTKYRNYIDDNYNNYNYNNNYSLPQNHLYQISDNCFVDHVNRCIGNKNLCQMYSLLKCIGPPRIT